MQPTVTARKPTWRERFAASRNLPPILRLVWEAAPSAVAAGLVLRLASALVPLATLWIAKWIIDLVVATLKPGPIPGSIWLLLAAEFGLAGLNQVVGRAIDYTDARLADEFTREVSLRVMEHAARLDLAFFEDPTFHDKLERARLQATDRIGMLNEMGRLFLQCITLITLSAGVMVYSPWLFALLIVCVTPAFAGESHFAFLGYSLAHSITPIRRELDYLRILGSSKEGAKEVKMFGLGGYLCSRYAQLTNQIIKKNIDLTRRRLLWGSIFALLGSIGYYGSYAFLVWRTLLGELSVGTMMFLTGAIAGSSTQLQGVFSLFSHIADQALHLTDLVDFLSIQPKIRSKSLAIAAPRTIRDGFEFRGVSFHYPYLKYGAKHFRLELFY